MKLHNKNGIQEASDEAFDQQALELHDINPICDIMDSSDRRQLVLSQKDLETIRHLTEAPPQPTLELIAGFKQVMQKRS